MAKIGLIALITIVLIALSFAGCSQGIVSVDKDSGWPWGPDAWNITDGKNTVSLYNGDCCCVADQIADTVAARINRGEYPWPMTEAEFDTEYLPKVCREIIKRTTGIEGSQPASGRE